LLEAARRLGRYLPLRTASSKCVMRRGSAHRGRHAGSASMLLRRTCQRP
jgi:hypothetical protein